MLSLWNLFNLEQLIEHFFLNVIHFYILTLGNIQYALLISSRLFQSVYFSNSLALEGATWAGWGVQVGCFLGASLVKFSGHFPPKTGHEGEMMPLSPPLGKGKSSLALSAEAAGLWMGGRWTV